MRYSLLTAMLFSTLFAFTQASKTKPLSAFAAHSPAGVYAVMPSTASSTSSAVNSTVVDTTYLSSTDFSGSGSATDPIRIKTSVIQNWLELLPGFSTGGGKYLASDFTWKTITTTASLPFLNAPSLTAVATGSSTISLSWSDVADESSYLLQRSQDNASWITIAQPAANSTQFTSSGLAASTLYYYRIKAVGNNTSYADSPFSSGSATTSSGGGTITNAAENLLFDLANAFNVQQHPDGAGTYYSSGGSGIGQALKKLAAGANGLVYLQYHTGTGELSSLGYTTANALQGYEHWVGGLFLLGTRVNAYGYNGSTTDLGVDAINNHFYGFRRTGTTMEIITSTDETNWTVLGYTNYAADDLFVQAYFQTDVLKIKAFGRNLVSY